MTCIVIKKEKEQIQRILIKGHSGFAESGKDIVCASISSMITLAINIVNELDESAIRYIQKEIPQPIIEIKKMNDNEAANKVLITLVKMLEELATDYPKNIKIRNEED